MNVTYRPIGHDWPGKRTTAYERTNSRFRRAGRYEGSGDGQRFVPGGSVPWNETLRLLDKELDMLEAKKLVFQLDLSESDIRLDGMPSARARINDPAVIVSFDSKHGPLRYFCDQFTDWHDNIRAIALGLEALRKVERYGITRKGEQYAGWKQLGSGSGQMENVVLVFAGPEDAAKFMVETAGHDGRGVEESVKLVLAQKAYRDQMFRTAAKRVHPDAGGSRADYETLVEARRIVESAAG